MRQEWKISFCSFEAGMLEMVDESFNISFSNSVLENADHHLKTHFSPWLNPTPIQPHMSIFAATDCNR